MDRCFSILQVLGRILRYTNAMTKRRSDNVIPKQPGKANPVSAAQAITMGIAADGGLFVPEKVPLIDKGDWQKLMDGNYQQKAVLILKPFLPEFSLAELEECSAKAYHMERFDDPQIAP